MTVFVPSNEALRKIPDEELEVIKNNSTALKGKFVFVLLEGRFRRRRCSYDLASADALAHSPAAAESVRQLRHLSTREPAKQIH